MTLHHVFSNHFLTIIHERHTLLPHIVTHSHLLCCQLQLLHSFQELTVWLKSTWMVCVALFNHPDCTHTHTYIHTHTHTHTALVHPLTSGLPLPHFFSCVRAWATLVYSSHSFTSCKPWSDIWRCAAICRVLLFGSVAAAETPVSGWLAACVPHHN